MHFATNSLLSPFLYTADSMTFEVLPYGAQQDKVQIHCSKGKHKGKYLLVDSNNAIIAGALVDGDSVFLRQNVAGTGNIITISLSPNKNLSSYVAFDADSRMAQLEPELTDRSKLELFNTEFIVKGKTDEDTGDMLEMQLDLSGDGSLGNTGGNWVSVLSIYSYHGS